MRQRQDVLTSGSYHLSQRPASALRAGRRHRCRDRRDSLASGAKETVKIAGGGPHLHHHRGPRGLPAALCAGKPCEVGERSLGGEEGQVGRKQLLSSECGRGVHTATASFSWEGDFPIPAFARGILLIYEDLTVRLLYKMSLNSYITECHRSITLWGVIARLPF